MRVNGKAKLLIGLALLIAVSGCGGLSYEDDEKKEENERLIQNHRAAEETERQRRENGHYELLNSDTPRTPVGTYEVIYNQCAKDSINQCDYRAHNRLVWLTEGGANDQLTFYPFNDYLNVNGYDSFKLGDAITSCNARIERKDVNGEERFVIEGECFETSGFSCTFEFVKVTSEILAKDAINCGANNNQP